MHNRFTIGQMSKLHSIPIKTLRYYDEIGLFKPAHIDSETGYRYYSIDQFELLDIIIYLKTVGVPLKQIKEQLERRILDSFLEVLQQQKKMLQPKSKNWNSLRNDWTTALLKLREPKPISLWGRLN